MITSYDECTIDELKQLGKEFLEILPTATTEEAENGFKCFTIAYLNSLLHNPREEIQAEALHHLLSRKLMEREIEIALTGDDHD